MLFDKSTLSFVIDIDNARIINCDDFVDAYVRCTVKNTSLNGEENAINKFIMKLK